ncbi:hypothetical protein Halhy_5225 [Haliscomenobacter hydrossis DSM 1100]|uniref:Uncharacterized protein n=1 Tax=Haliscomenobacter hydrossis (strain ATCC 27775 / DSM 1100 / LMG 10767 / O) TaxID=760192 RepID=F4L5Z1_HALH1|nr:hypothetical protein Halhy_5225 [Haliscomenobacter hydrossis DSM 1100]
MGTRMTRIERIYADIDSAYGEMSWPQIANEYKSRTG